jgi:photosynthetic reaction center cytochrome c subunit
VNILGRATGSLTLLLVAAAAVSTYKSTAAFQMGYRGVGMEVIDSKEHLAEKVKANELPPTLPPASHDGQLAVDAYKNVQILGHLSSGEVTRLMTAITIWVAPDAGCAYCHAPQRDAKGEVIKNAQGYPLADNNALDSDELYTKRVARRMLQMTMHINTDWKDHVKTTGVTCYTCHRGNPVPQNIWFDRAENATRYQGIPNPPDQYGPSVMAGLTSLPGDALEPFLEGDTNIRIQSTEAIGSDNRSSIKQTEWTYALMIHMSNALGVNCTYCHNTRSIGEWSTSPATRAQAWYGIRMVRDLNKAYLGPLASTFPPERHGALGDGPKANCATCHNGAYKPLLGASMLKDYDVLAEAKPQPPKTPAAMTAPPTPAPTADLPTPAASGSAAVPPMAPVGSGSAAPSASAPPSSSSGQKAVPRVAPSGAPSAGH